MNTALFETGCDVLRRQSFSILLGATLEKLEPGQIEMSLPVRQDLLQQHGFVHGGVIAYLADNALTYAGGSLLGDAVTSEFKINFLRPVAGGGRLVAIASALAQGKTQAVCRCDVFSVMGGTRKQCAAAQGTIRKAG
jgi:uncharacterized protein (TIGR00369 family)